MFSFSSTHSQKFSKMFVPIYTFGMWEFWSLHVLTNISHLFNFSHFGGYVVLHNGLFTFSWWLMMLSPFHILIVHLNILFCGVSVKSCQCFYSVVFFLLTFLLIYYFLFVLFFIFWIMNHFIDICTVLPFCKLCFHSHNGIFGWKEVLNFHEVKIYQNLYVIVILFVYYLRTLWSPRCSPMFT